MVSIFGQVWLWSLLAFVAGVLLTWLVLVRPVKGRVGELEDQLADARRRSRPTQAAAASSRAEPLPDGDFDEWHVESRSLVDEVLTPEYTGPPAQPYPAPRNQAPQQPAPQYQGPQYQEPVVPEYVAPEPAALPEPVVQEERPVEAAYVPEPEPEPDYDELPPALTRIDEPRPEHRAHEAEPPRSLYERLSPETALPGVAPVVPEVPVAEATGRFSVADLEPPDLPVEETQYLATVQQQPPVAEIAPVAEEPTAPPEVEDFQPVEVWRGQAEPEPVVVEQQVDEDELIEDEPTPFEPVVRDDVSASEQTSFISVAEVERILAEEDAAEVVAAAEETVVPAVEEPAVEEPVAQEWPDRDLTGEYPVITEEIASSRGQLAEAEAEEPEPVAEDVVAEEAVAEEAAEEVVAEDVVAEEAAVEEPPAPVAPTPTPAPAPPVPVVERPRSLFEPIVDADADVETPAEQPRALQPLSDQPFVPVLAPELLEAEKSGNGLLPQRPQRAPGSARQSPPPLSARPVSPPPPPPEPPRPVRPRPVGFSPSTGGRAPAANGSTTRYQQPEGFNPRSPFGPGSVLPKSDGLAPAPDFEVKATLTGRRYYTNESANFRETRADVWFRTVSDAQKAGFRQAP